jgi:hypothetical protein
MKTNEEKISLSNICGGSAIERFDLALGGILDNILDPNTEAIVTRELILKVKISPNLDRELANISFQVISKPAPLSPVFATAVIGKGIRGEAEAHELYKPKQQEIPNNVTSLERKVKND